jgi:predicted SAM-dependent methyltransferase
LNVAGLFQRRKAEEPPLRLHIGCGQQAIPGWINIDNQALPGVDRVLDIRRGLPFHGVAAIYAEHFLEHIGFDDALAFLKECRRVLADLGVLRISTPNLDWVYTTHYPSWPSGAPEERLRDCFQMNQAFHGWGHQFLYNRTMLESVLRAAGFSGVVFQSYGRSDIPDLNAIERHQTYPDTPDLPHVLIAEASGKGHEEPLPADLIQNFHVIINAR